MNKELKLSIFMMIVSQVLSVDPCSGPITFNSTDFTIRGPCPNDTVLAPVGSTVHYRCDYEDRSSSSIVVPYWHIPGLTGTPFLKNQGSEDDLLVTTTFGNGLASADLTVTVREQYLNYTLTIQCGVFMCTGIGMCNNDMLSDISTSTTLVVFGVPRNLSSHGIVGKQDDGTVTLHWSAPLVSADYTSLKTVEFEYQVKIFDTNNTHLQTFNTTHNQLTLSRLNISSKSHAYVCRELLWSVAAIVDGDVSQHVKDNSPFILQTTPKLTSNIDYHEDDDDLLLNFTVSTVQPLYTLDYRICVNYSNGTVYDCFSTQNNTFSNIAFLNNSVNLYVPLTLDNFTEFCIILFVTNDCGNFDNSRLCEFSSSSIAISTTTTSFLTLTQFTTTSTSFSISSVSSFLTPTSSSTPSQNIILIVIPVFIVLLLCCSLALTVFCVALFVKRKLTVFHLNKSKENMDNSAAPVLENGLYTSAIVCDYLSPGEAVDAKQTYQMTTISSSEYCEPEKLRSPSFPLSLSSSHQRQKTGTWRADTKVEDTPGYCVPPPVNTIHSSSETRNSLQKQKEESGQIKPSEENCSTVPAMYADIDEIKVKKINNNTGYASLDLLPSDDKPPPIPPPCTDYSVIVPDHGYMDMGPHTETTPTSPLLSSSVVINDTAHVQEEGNQYAEIGIRMLNNT